MKPHLDFGLNRIIKPDLSLTEFIRFAASCGAKYVEIRNDLADPSLLGGETPETINDTCRQSGISVLTVNALQRFNDPSLLEAKKQELRQIMETAASVGCRRIVLCPVNDPADNRGPEENHRDLVEALRGYAPLFDEHGMIGLVEPLGFAICSVRFKRQAAAAIAESGCDALYKLVHDTFHHYLSGEKDVFPEQTGLVHASGVPGGKVMDEITDDDRVLVDSSDIMDNRAQLRALRSGGCTAELSYEPFSSKVGGLSVAELRSQVTESLAYLLAE